MDSNLWEAVCCHAGEKKKQTRLKVKKPGCWRGSSTHYLYGFEEADFQPGL